MDVAESITNSWTVFEHIKGIKRWKEDDLAWIKMSQENLVESLGQLIGRDRAMKRVANARIALRKWQDEEKQKESSRLAEEVKELDASDELTREPGLYNE